MPEEIRFNAALDAAREIQEQLGCPAADAESLSMIAYTVLEAIYQAENALAEYACRFLCPKCFRLYRVHVSLRGRSVKCVGCGHRWRAPELVGRN